MKSLLFSAVLSLGLLGSAAFGNQLHSSAVTMNEPASYVYSSDAALPFILAQGYLRTEVVAIGGETTGFELDLLDGSQTYELILSSDLQQKIKHLNGMIVEAEGKLRFLPGTERQPRPAIIVKDLRILE